MYYIIIVRYNNVSEYVWMYSCNAEDVQYWQIQAAMNNAIDEIIVVKEDDVIVDLVKNARSKTVSHYIKEKS